MAVLLVMKVNGFGPFGMLGTATGLSGGKLILSVAINFILGMLMCAGVGLYAPCMALCALVGMNITVAFPIMMGSCALLMPPASLEFVKSGRYNRDAAVIMSITGVIGVLIAYFIVKSMPTTILTYIVAVVLIYMAISFVVIKSEREEKGRKLICHISSSKIIKSGKKMKEIERRIWQRQVRKALAEESGVWSPDDISVSMEEIAPDKFEAETKAGFRKEELLIDSKYINFK